MIENIRKKASNAQGVNQFSFGDMKYKIHIKNPLEENVYQTDFYV